LRLRLLEKEQKKQAWLVNPFLSTLTVIDNLFNKQDMVNEKKRKKEEWLRKRKEWEDGIKERYVQTNELPPCLTKHNIYRERKKIEFAQNKKKWDEQKERELGRKIFVGGFKFDDLTEEGNIFDDFLISRINLPSSLLLKLLVRQLLLNSLPRGGEDF